MKNIFSILADQLVHDLLDLPIDRQEAEAESELILSSVTGLSRSERVIATQSEVPIHWQSEIARILSQRRLRVPIQYCLGSVRFMGLDFRVEPGVLIPRVDTEQLVKVILDLLTDRYKGSSVPKELRIAEIGVGAGPISIALLKNFNNASCWACDVSAKAIALTRRNAELHGVSDRLELAVADWKDSLPYDLDIVLANPPYISRIDKVNLAPEIAWHEPDQALFTEDTDGLSFYRDFALLLPEHFSTEQSLVAFEIGDNQAELVKTLFAAAKWRQIKTYRDLNGMERVLSAVVPRPTSKFA